jgi:hypothetical protein
LLVNAVEKSLESIYGLDNVDVIDL